MNPELLRFLKKSISDFGGEFEDNRVVMQFIPIILVLLFSLYMRRFIEVGNSILGKLFAVVLIMFYTKLNILYGVLACVITILFYQLTEGSVIDETAEGMQNTNRGFWGPVPASTTTSNQTFVTSGQNRLISNQVSSGQPLICKPSKKDRDSRKPSNKSLSEEDDVEDGTNLPDETNNNNDTTEGFESYQSLYPVINIEDFNAAKEEFIKEKCKNGVVMYKDMPVKPEMVDHVFSEINFTTKTKCNPCDRTCAYTIVESKLATEEELGRPKNSNDVFEWIKQLF